MRWQKAWPAPEILIVLCTWAQTIPLGPLALADFVGLDITLDILDALERDLKSDKYRACPLLRDKVARGELGRKTGRGFFSYS